MGRSRAAGGVGGCRVRRRGGRAPAEVAAAARRREGSVAPKGAIAAAGAFVVAGEARPEEAEEASAFAALAGEETDAASLGDRPRLPKGNLIF